MTWRALNGNSIELILCWDVGRRPTWKESKGEKQREREREGERERKCFVVHDSQTIRPTGSFMETWKHENIFNEATYWQ